MCWIECRFRGRSLVAAAMLGQLIVAIFCLAVIITSFSGVGSRGSSSMSLPPGSWLFGGGRLAVDAAESEFLMRVPEEGRGLIEPRHPINCSR